MSLSSSKGTSGYKVYRIAVLLILGLGVSLPVWAQSTPAGEATMASSTDSASRADKMTFEVASVRPGPRSVIKGMDFLDPVNKAAPPEGGLFSWNVPVAYLIYFAYDLRSSQLRRAVGEQLPKWTQEQWYTVEARAAGNPSRNDVRQMVRSLLEERFQFAAHGGTREGQVNALTVIRPGVGLKPHAQGAPCELSLPTTAWAYPPYKDVPVRCGVFDRQLGKYTRRIEMADVTMQQVADALSRHSPLAVVDATGLAGHYDGFLDYGPEMLPPDADPSAEAGLPVAAALEKQLGLKLVKQNATVDYFVIDRIEKPSEN